MLFNFASVPIELQRIIIGKLDFISFSTLAQTNHAISHICIENANRVTVKVRAIKLEENEQTVDRMVSSFDWAEAKWAIATKIPCRISADSLQIQVPLTDEKVVDLIEKLKRNRASASVVIGYGDISCSLESFDQLLTTIGCRVLDLGNIPAEYFETPAVQNLGTIAKARDLNDSQILSLRATIINLRSSQITNQGIKEFLKEWRRKERTIKNLSIRREIALNEDVEEIVQGLDANIIWTPEWHHLSLISQHVMNTQSRVYSLFPSDDISDVHILHFRSDGLHMYQDAAEKYVLDDLLWNE